MSEVGILIVDNDVASQSALKNILDSEGWRVRIVTSSSQAMSEIASGNWNLVIANVEVAELGGPLFAILRELASAESQIARGNVASDRKYIRALFLVPVKSTGAAQRVLESEGLPYALKPCHLHDFLERVSELLVDSGAIAEPIRSIGGFGVGKRRTQDIRFSRTARNSAMFANREHYYASEEELSEFERQQQEDHERHEQEQKRIKNRGQS